MVSSSVERTLPDQRDLLSGERVLGVHDAVAVTLLGEEPLPVGCEVSVDRVTSDHGVEARGRSLRFGSQQPAEALRLLPGAEGTETWTAI